LLLPDGTLAEHVRVEGAHVGWRTNTGELLPVDAPRLCSAQPSGAVLHADGRLDRSQRVPRAPSQARRPFLP
jgi:hypothetical protein